MVLERSQLGPRPQLRSAGARLSLGIALAGVLSASLPNAVRFHSNPGSVARAFATTSRPNIVMLMTDDQRADELKAMPKTRHLIGDKGITFTNAFVSYPICCPSRATYFTGQYSHNNGVLYNHAPNGGYAALREKDTTFPVALRRAGYNTTHMGKYLNGVGSSAATIPPGWSDFYGSVDPTTYNYYGFKLNHNGVIRTYPATERYYRTDVFARLAQSVIRREAHSAHPFFLNVAFLAPHSAGPQEEAAGPQPAGIGHGLMDNRLATPPARYRTRFHARSVPQGPAFNEADMSDKPRFLQTGRYFQALTASDRADITARYRARLASLMAVDDAVKGIMDTLRETGQLDNTIVLFTSDNGFFYGEHRIRGGKYFVYDPAVRVPLLMRGPGIPAGVTRDQMVGNIDLAPTILALTHARPLRLMDGRSLTPLLHGNASAAHWNRALLFESGANTEYPAVYHAIRTDRYVYVEYSTGDRELYDMKTDPDQLRSRQNDPVLADIREELQAHLSQLRVCRGSTCR